MATLFATTLITASSASADDLSATLAKVRPTPCLDAVAPFFITEIIANGSHSFLADVGRQKNLSQTWAPGNPLYDQAYSVVFSVFSNDEVFKEQFRIVSAKTYLVLQFRRASSQEQDYLSKFFASKEGAVYWEYMLDGATCEGLFSGVSKRKVPITAEQLVVAENWIRKFPLKKEEFEAEYLKLTAAQKKNFDKGYKLLSRLSNSEAPDEVAFQVSLISDEKFILAAKRSALPAMKDLNQIIDGFAGSRD